MKHEGNSPCSRALLLAAGKAKKNPPVSALAGTGGSFMGLQANLADGFSAGLDGFGIGGDELVIAW